MAEFLLLGTGARDGVAVGVHDGPDPAFRRACVAQDRADRIGGETDRQDVAQLVVPNDRHPQGN